MKMTKPNLVRFVCCLLAFGAALVWPVQRIIQFECTKDYTLHRFKVTLYDPYDLMRGHYLRFSILPGEWRSNRDLGNIKTCRVVLTCDQEGFAQIRELSTTSGPKVGTFRAKCSRWRNRHWIKGKWVDDPKEKWKYDIRYPFNRYFINERFAADAEALVRNAVKAKRPAEIWVRVYADGGTMIEKLLIDGKPINELLREAPKKEAKTETTPATPSVYPGDGKTK